MTPGPAIRWASILILAWGSAATAVAAEPSEAGLRAADAEQMRIIVEEDATAQGAFMHENYIINGPSNRVMRKNVLLDMLSKGGMASERFEREIEATAITGSIGIVMGRETVVPAPGSQLGQMHGSVTLQRRFTNVFLFEGGKWRFLARQATIVNE